MPIRFAKSVHHFFVLLLCFALLPPSPVFAFGPEPLDPTVTRDAEVAALRADVLRTKSELDALIFEATKGGPTYIGGCATALSITAFPLLLGFLMARAQSTVPLPMSVVGMVVGFAGLIFAMRAMEVHLSRSASLSKLELDGLADLTARISRLSNAYLTKKKEVDADSVNLLEALFADLRKLSQAGAKVPAVQDALRAMWASLVTIAQAWEKSYAASIEIPAPADELILQICRSIRGEASRVGIR